MERFKYPRTPHLSWSPGATDDDKMLSYEEVLAMFLGREVVVTEKMDGENTTIYPDGYTHARSRDSAHHPSRSWVKGLAGQVGSEGLPSDLRICGENCFAEHSIGYDRLPGYFLAFSVWREDENLSWDELVFWASLLGIPTVPVLWRGIWDEARIRGLWPFESRHGPVAEGYVVRVTSSFPGSEFDRHVAKFVRPRHVQTDQHWMSKSVVPNRLAE